MQEENNNSCSSERGYSENGVALIIVLFVLALASILVVNLASSTSLSSHRISYAQRAIEAEYLLKSAMNLGRGLIASQGSTSTSDSVQSPWGIFAMGAPIPNGLLPELPENVEITLEIRPEDTKIPLRQISPGATVNTFWATALQNLMENLGFNQDGEEDHTGRFPGRKISCQEMVGLVIDYLDTDSTSYVPSLGESDLPKEWFLNKPEIHRLEDLAALPGFTPKRLQRLAPYVTTAESTGTVNLNLTPYEVLVSLPGVSPSEAQGIIGFRSSNQGPFTSIRYSTDLASIAPTLASSSISYVSATSMRFSIIAKVDYGTSKSFLKALATRGNPSTVEDVELY